jgi:hypothetical protein
MRNIFPKRKSIFVFSLVASSLSVGALLAVVVISMTGQGGISAEETRNRSFQVADSGMERILDGIYEGSAEDVNALATAHSGVCADGFIAGTAASGAYKVALYDADNNRIACDDRSWKEKMVSLGSEGYTDDTGRFVEVAEAQAVGNKNCHAVGPIGSGSWRCNTDEYVQMVMANGVAATQMFVMCCQF